MSSVLLDKHAQSVDGTALDARVALVCDYAEENWPSMDYYGDTLYSELRSSNVRASHIRPQMPRPFGRAPILRNFPQAFLADRLLGRFVHYPRVMRRQAGCFDLFHIVDHSYAHLCHELPADRVIVTCHDLDAFRCLLQPEEEPRPAWFRALAVRQREGLQRAAHVICDSHAVRNQLLSYGLCPPERVSVVPIGVHPSCRPDSNPAADAEAAALLGPAQGPVLLHVGSTIPRKRIDVLLEVFANILRQYPQARLIRVGGSFTVAQAELASSLGVHGHITILPFLTRDVLAAVYRCSTVALLPSEAEGFGLPLVEALACGTPVVASGLPVLREIGGDAATYCEVAEIAAWSEVVSGHLAEWSSNNDAWNARRMAGLDHAGSFRWAETARQVIRVYQTLSHSLRNQ